MFSSCSGTGGYLDERYGIAQKNQFTNKVSLSVSKKILMFININGGVGCSYLRANIIKLSISVMMSN